MQLGLICCFWIRLHLPKKRQKPEESMMMFVMTAISGRLHQPIRRMKLLSQPFQRPSLSQTSKNDLGFFAFKKKKQKSGGLTDAMQNY